MKSPLAALKRIGVMGLLEVLGGSEEVTFSD